MPLRSGSHAVRWWVKTRAPWLTPENEQGEVLTHGPMQLNALTFPAKNWSLVDRSTSASTSSVQPVKPLKFFQK